MRKAFGIFRELHGHWREVVHKEGTWQSVLPTLMIQGTIVLSHRELVCVDQASVLSAVRCGNNFDEVLVHCGDWFRGYFRDLQTLVRFLNKPKSVLAHTLSNGFTMPG